MAKAKKKAASSSDNFLAKLAKDNGGDVIGDMDKEATYFIDTGNLAINYTCSGKFINGGIPGGRLTEIYGPSASSKSLIGSNLLFGCQKLNGIGILLDSENAVNKDFISKASHADLSRILRFTPTTLEESFGIMYRMIEQIRSDKSCDGMPIVIVYDSISVSPCERESREVNLPEEYSKETFKKIVGAKEQPGERARICGKELRKLNPLLEENNVSVIILNQIRDKIGVMYGSPETTAGGGNALPFYSSLRFRTQTQKKIEQKIEGLAKKKAIGINIKISNKKNRATSPFKEVENIPLFFEHGFNPLGGLLGALLLAGRIKVAGKGSFTVLPQYADGKEDYNFKSSIARNDVPVSVLLDCPSLVDAASAEEVSEYLEPFKSAIEFSDNPDIEAFDVPEDSDEELDELA